MFIRWKINRLQKKIKSMQSNRVHNQPTDELIKKEISYYFDLADYFKSLKGHTKYPYAEAVQIECYRAAALLEDSQAHFQLGNLFLDEAKFRQDLDKVGMFNSQENSRRCKQLYNEAHVHLQVAESLGHIAAKRLRGLCYINGWGMDMDKEKGFELVVASIEQEGSWERVPQLFAEIGLNKPEFFEALLQRRKNT